MENPYESTIEMKPVEKKEPETVSERKNKPISTFTMRKSLRTQHRDAGRRNIFSK